MSRQHVRGQAAMEFAVVCVVFAAALCLPWNGAAPVALQWFQAWLDWRASGLSWLADG